MEAQIWRALYNQRDVNGCAYQNQDIMKHRCLTEEKLWEYIDDELSTVNRLKAEHHLEECANCRHRLAEFKSLHTDIKKVVHSKVFVGNKKR